MNVKCVVAKPECHAIEPVRFEIMPFARGEAEAAAISKAIRLTVTCSAKHGLDRTVEVAVRLRELGHAVTVHLAARMVRDRMHLDEVLFTLAVAGVDDVFVVGGDAGQCLGPYSSAVQVLQIVHEHSNRPHKVGVAGYPEGHPLIDAGALLRSLQDKTCFADYITTQLCFSPEAVLAWVQAIRQAEIRLPLFLGLPGLVDRRRLLEISVRVGVGPSLSFLRRQGGSLFNLARASRSMADRLYEALSPFVGDPKLGIAGMHYFTFNQLLATWSWERARSA